MTSVLQTEKSALILHDFEPEICNLIEKCVETVDSELDVNPEIRVFGKECHQHRSIGFYSDTSKGYNYSTTITPSKKMHPCLRELLHRPERKMRQKQFKDILNINLTEENLYFLLCLFKH